MKAVRYPLNMFELAHEAKVIVRPTMRTCSPLQAAERRHLYSNGACFWFPKPRSGGTPLFETICRSVPPLRGLENEVA